MIESKTIIIDKETHKKLKLFCKSKKLKINEYVNNLIEESLLIEKSQLPKILKKSEDIVEITLCNFLSNEYKNNMPKELTLLRNTSDGSGFIANYVQK